MLSRIAESLFWIGRYVERADDTSRILDVNLQYLLEDPWAEEELSCRSLLAIMNHPAGPDDEVNSETVMQLLARDPDNSSSIAGALIAARENARRAREAISSELWECLNTTRNEVGRRSHTMIPHEFFVWVRERAAIVAGLMDSATSRDSTWDFMVLGRSIERADMTARLLTTQVRLGEAGPGWSELLRSCGAHEAFLRAQSGRLEDDDAAANFLLRDRIFPRSIVAALGYADGALRELEPTEGRRGVEDEARRELGVVRSELEYAVPQELIADLPAVMGRVQLACSRASNAIADRYFPATAMTNWTREAL